MIKLIATSFLPRAVGGAATRLKIFLEEADTQGFKDPPGMLQAGFWGTKVSFACYASTFFNPYLGYVHWKGCWRLKTSFTSFFYKLPTLNKTKQTAFVSHIKNDLMTVRTFVFEIILKSVNHLQA